MELAVGMIVEVTGLDGDAKPVGGMEDVIAPMNLNGAKAQLIEFDRDSKKWVAGTFEGALIAVAEKYLKPLPLEDMGGLDFFMGPKSDPAIVSEQLSDLLASKGFAAVKVFVTKADTAGMLEATQILEEEDQFGRLPVEFEPGYLGINGSAKVVHVDPQAGSAPSYIADSPLKVVDNNFSAISSMLSPHASVRLGSEVYSRTSMLIRLPIADHEEEKYPPADVEEAEAESYLHLMQRRQITVLQFVGPESGTFKLLPKRSGGAECTLKAEPNTMILINPKVYEYSFEPAGRCLTLQTFILSAPPVWELGDVQGDASKITASTRTGPPPPKDPQICVVSAFTRYGMGVNGMEQYWIAAGKAGADGATEFPSLRWDPSSYYDPDQSFGGTYTKHGTFGIDGVDLFDCKFFDISAAEARGMAPTQRQVMEVSYMALAGAGYDKKSLQRRSENIGHFVGIDKDDWLTIGSFVDIDVGAYGAAGAADSITANRFSFSLNLKGASMQIDTACSSSLVCTHVSKMHLRMQEWDPMPCSIVNGLNLMLHVGVYVSLCQASMLSHEGRCFTFNATADGYQRGELCGAAGFKQIKFDDTCLNALAGTQANQDGRSASLTAPNGPAQERCLQAVMRESGMSPSEIDIFECHGTGTALGDPIEIGSFRKVMSMTERKDPLYIASSKSNICHGEGGAGLAGFLKCCMQTQHCESSPNLHLKILNPHLDLDGFPCQPLTESNTCREMAAYCGVSSFGFGGTNAHAEAWAPQIATSRGGVNQKDPEKLFVQKLMTAPVGEITINGDDVADWDTTGMDPRAEPGDEFMISLGADGALEWEKYDPDLAESYGDEFFIQGTFNDWSSMATPMERHSSIPGLWSGRFTIGSTGFEEFQIIGDNDLECVYAPKSAKCTSKVAPIKGPEACSREFAWLVRGLPGDVFLIEFFQQDETKSILWRKVA